MATLRYVWTPIAVQPATGVGKQRRAPLVYHFPASEFDFCRESRLDFPLTNETRNTRVRPRGPPCLYAQTVWSSLEHQVRLIHWPAKQRSAVFPTSGGVASLSALSARLPVLRIIRRVSSPPVRREACETARALGPSGVSAAAAVGLSVGSVCGEWLPSASRALANDDGPGARRRDARRRCPPGLTRPWSAPAAGPLGSHKPADGMPSLLPRHQGRSSCV